MLMKFPRSSFPFVVSVSCLVLYIIHVSFCLTGGLMSERSHHVDKLLVENVISFELQPEKQTETVDVWLVYGSRA